MLDQEFSEVRAKLVVANEIRTEISEVEIERLALMLEHSMLKADDEIRQDGLTGHSLGLCLMTYLLTAAGNTGIE